MNGAPHHLTITKSTAVVSWLLVDNVDHIKAYWIMMTPQIALRFGADDLDGTVVEEKIYHDAGATTNQGMRRGEIASADPRGGPQAAGARHAVPSRGADGSGAHGVGVAAYRAARPGNDELTCAYREVVT